MENFINVVLILGTRENLRRYGYLAKAKVYEGDLFDKLAQQSKFDKIIFNAPFHGTKPQDSGYLWLSVVDPEYKSLKKFLNNAKNYLKQNGVIYLCFSTTGDVQLLENHIQENRYMVAEKFTKKCGDYDLLLFKLVY